jgi:hypothetical protein
MTFPAATVNTPTFGPPFYNAAKNEVILARLPPDPNRGTNTQITYKVVFDHASEIINTQHPGAFLDGTRRVVERVLLATEAECRRLGLPID